MALAPVGHACACGAAVAPSGTQATFNHEVALVHWDGSTETILMHNVAVPLEPILAAGFLAAVIAAAVLVFRRRRA